MNETILVVDDEEVVLSSVRRTLRAAGLTSVVTTSDPRHAEGLLSEYDVAVLLLDLVMPHVSGQEVLELVTRDHPDVQVVVVTAEQDARVAVSCMKLGAWDYLLKPVSGDELTAVVQRALEHRETLRENALLREKLLDQAPIRSDAFRSIVTADPAMERVFSYLEVVSRGSHPILVTGETGTGKELFARAIHRSSALRGQFVAVNVAGLDDAMFTDTLFGHKPGAFTGATGSRKGMAEQAAGGTLFLDEIGDLSEASQVKLLRLLQEREYYALGSDVPSRLNARIVAATHRDPSRLRADLYFRLRSYHVRIPPLRERRGDLPFLVEQFVREAADDLGKEPPVIPSELFRQLERYGFPGNVRELRAMVFDAVARHARGALPVEPFVESMGLTSTAFAATEPSRAEVLLDQGEIIPELEWKQLERSNLVNALQRANWKISGAGGAAELLGVKPTTLESRMKSLSIERPK